MSEHADQFEDRDDDELEPLRDDEDEEQDEPADEPQAPSGLHGIST